MAEPRPFRALHASDGSQSARAAMTTSASFPWPGHGEARTRTGPRVTRLVVGVDGSAASDLSYPISLER